jgi:hypothetical protein
MLKTEDCFILDAGTAIYVWVGKGSSKEEKKGAMLKGTDFCSSKGRPKGTKVVKVTEGYEPTAFKSEFASWSDPLNPAGFGYTPKGGKRVSTNAADAVGDMMGKLGDMMSGRKRAMSMEDMSDVSTQVYRIEDLKLVEQEPAFLGQFYAGDAYLICYKYKNGDKPEAIVYFWLGQQASQDEVVACAKFAVDKDDELTAEGWPATQVRVVMGKEPAHFVRLFQGKMCVRSGGKASGFKNRGDIDSYDTDGTELYHVKGSVPRHARGADGGDGRVAQLRRLLRPADARQSLPLAGHGRQRV